MPREKVEDLQESITYQVLPESRIEDALAVQQESMRRENLALAVGMYDEKGSAEHMMLVFREVIKDGHTIVAIDKSTRRVIGVCFNKLWVPLPEGESDPFVTYVENTITDDACNGLIKFLGDTESRVDLYGHYGVDCAMEIFYVGIRTEFCGRGIGLNLMKASIEHGRRIEGAKKPKIAFGVFTSTFSQRIATKLGFDWLVTVPYEDATHKEKKFSERLSDSQTCAKLGALRLIE